MTLKEKNNFKDYIQAKANMRDVKIIAYEYNPADNVK